MNPLLLNHLIGFSLIAVVLPAIAALVYFSRPKNILNQVFAVYSLAIAWWSFFTIFMIFSPSPKWGLFWDRMCLTGVVFIPSTLFHFIAAYTRDNVRLKLLVRINYFISLFFLTALWLTDFFVAEVQPKFGMKYFTVPGQLYIFYVTFFICTVVLAMFFLTRFRSSATHVRIRKQAAFLFWFSVIGYTGGSCNYLLVYDVNLPGVAETSNYGVLILSLSIAYIIFRYHFLDIEVIIKRTLVFAGMFGMVMVTAALVTTFAQSFISQYFPIGTTLSMMLSGLAIILLYAPTKKWLTHVTENILFQQPIDYEKIDRDISDQIQITDLAMQLRNIGEIFKEGFLLENVAILLLDEEEQVYRLAHHAGEYRRTPPVRRLTVDSKAIARLKSYPKNVLVKSSLLAKGDHELLKLLESWEAEAACRVPFKDAVIAILFLGKKKSDREFAEKDTLFLDKLAKNLGVSINNATTFKIKENYFVLMAEKNKTDVLARLSEGIDHEIKNPLNAIKPAAQRSLEILKKGEAIVPEEIARALGQYLEMIIRNTDRITGVMTRLRNFARPIRTAEGFKLEPIVLRDGVDEAIELVSQKQLELDNVTVENRVPENLRIFGDHPSIIQVFWNLINNAYHAIDRNGRIIISARVSENDGKVMVAVSDTGKGIPPEHRDKIFTPFFTTKPTNLPGDGSLRFTGTGLGLCYVKQYVESLGGGIMYESRVGEGTTFYLKFLRADAVKGVSRLGLAS